MYSDEAIREPRRRAQHPLGGRRPDHRAVRERHRPRPQVHPVAPGQAELVLVHAEPGAYAATGSAPASSAASTVTRPARRISRGRATPPAAPRAGPARPARAASTPRAGRQPRWCRPAAVRPVTAAAGTGRAEPGSRTGRSGTASASSWSSYASNEHRDGGERRGPGGQPVAARQQVDEHAHGQAHQVLDGGHQREAVQRPQHPQHEAVAAHPAGVGDQPQPGGQVRRRVAAEPHDRPERQRSQHPQHEGRQQHQPEQPVPPCPRRQPNRVH